MKPTVRQRRLTLVLAAVVLLATGISRLRLKGIISGFFCSPNPPLRRSGFPSPHRAPSTIPGQAQAPRLFSNWTFTFLVLVQAVPRPQGFHERAVILKVIIVPEHHPTSPCCDRRIVPFSAATCCASTSCRKTTLIPDILNVSTNCFSVSPVPTYRSVNSTLLRLPRICLSTAGCSSPTAGLISTLIS